MKYIISLHVQVIVEAPNPSLAEQIAWRDREALLQQPIRYISGATYIREAPKPS